MKSMALNHIIILWLYKKIGLKYVKEIFMYLTNKYFFVDEN